MFGIGFVVYVLLGRRNTSTFELLDNLSILLSCNHQESIESSLFVGRESVGV